MPVLTMPPLIDDSGKPELWVGIKFSNGLVSIEIIDEGGGAYLSIEIEGEPWKVTVEELFALAKWAEEAVAAVDKHNGNIP
jgi:hypothetical protein